MKSKPKVLILNDRPDILNLLERLLHKMNVHPLCASTLKEGRRILQENTDIIAIFVDGNMHDETNHPDTPKTSEEFVRYVRNSGYIKRLVAASAAYNDDLIAAGCDSGCQTPEIPKKVREFLAQAKNFNFA